ncbi:DsbA family protein [Phycicoccus sonneratiae]|uniref:Thioredoxin domain-containing protein n=1 Tax=Phycicoccus sonneratiae TaxID=2807628 RepID=A0ABS2CHY1_9MICO|nr:thioredoxin domain-containing protein [Phycicoccus sonneraticus]MBM6399473.1 thioredoxin domain-containing protein [Phycicoccus sonneraticus]
MAKKTSSTKAAGTARQAKIQAAQKASGGGSNKIVVATVVVVVAIVAVVGGVVWSQAKKQASVGTSTAVPAGSSMGKPFRAYADVTPVAGAPTVDLYEDFQCPNCGQFEGILGETIRDLGQSGKIVLNYHVLNFLDKNTGARNSTPAANGAFCAATTGKFQQFHDAVYRNQKTEGEDVDQATLDGWAKVAGITGSALTAWNTCVADGTYDRYIQSVNDAAFKLPGFQGTPTVSINGEMKDLRTVGTVEGFTKAVQDATK